MKMRCMFAMTREKISTAFSRENRLLRAVMCAAAAAARAAGLTVASGRGAPAAPRATTVAVQAPPACTAGTTAQTKDGPVCGLTASSITSYLDIPFAAPPVGKLRWQPPQPHAPWTATLQATTAAPECPSPGFPPGSPPATGTSEDCLYLKVEIPAGTKPGEKLPGTHEG